MAETRNRDPLARQDMTSLKNWGELPDSPAVERMRPETVVDAGWGRLIFAQTFDSHDRLITQVLGEQEGQRDIAFYVRDPHVLLSMAPQDLFLDPSHTFRLDFADYRPAVRPPEGFTVRRLADWQDEERLNRIYLGRGMVPAWEGYYTRHLDDPRLVFLVAEDSRSGALVGGVTGIDHRAAFEDPDNGSSLWSLAVDPQSPLPGVGEALVRGLIETFRDSGRSFMDLSVMHDNAQAIALYDKLGFAQVPVYCLKKRNPINEKLFIGPPPEAELNVYARIIVDEARRRGIGVEVIDPEAGYFCLSLGGRTVVCRESLSEMTTAIAMSRCDDKQLTRRLLAGAGLSVADQITVGPNLEGVEGFLDRHQRVVVKPARGEQGQGISVDLATLDEVEAAVGEARRFCDRVLIEQFVTGDDLRIIVIDFKVVACAVRRPASVKGDGRHTIRQLIDKQSRRRAAATGGESRIPLDAETHRCVTAGGFAIDDVLPAGQTLAVRKTANLHTGGTIHDVTDRVHRKLIEAAVNAARALDIPVVGLDFLVPGIGGPDHVIIEANERPGLANHEPQPTAERFIDLLFPQTRYAPALSA